MGNCDRILGNADCNFLFDEKDYIFGYDTFISSNVRDFYATDFTTRNFISKLKSTATNTRRSIHHQKYHHNNSSTSHWKKISNQIIKNLLIVYR